MSLDPLTVPPAAPAPIDTPAAFAAKADARVAWEAVHVAEMNVRLPLIDAAVTAVTEAAPLAVDAAEEAAADRVQTGEDRIQTGLDRIAAADSAALALTRANAAGDSADAAALSESNVAGAIVAERSVTATVSNKTLASPIITGVAEFANGSVSAPSITNTGDTNTGIYFPAEDTVTLAAGGTNRVSASSTGVALNGATVVSGALNATGNVTAEGNLILLGAGSTTTPYVQHTAATLDIKGGSTGGVRILNNAATVANATFSDSGNVGFGTAPVSLGTNVATVDIAGTAGGGIRVRTSGAGNSGYFQAVASGVDMGTGDALPVRIVSGGSTRATFDASGNQGLGVTPAAWGSSWKAIQVASNGTFSSLYTNLASNAYRTNSAWKYIASSITASRIDMNLNGTGSVAILTAPSGTADADITFTQVLEVAPGKTLALQGATSATGCGIAFPATQVPSSDPNTLDDCDRSNWTPALTFATPGTLAITYLVQSGKVVKIGREAIITGRILISAGNFNKGTASGALTLTGLPYVSDSAPPGYFYLDLSANSTDMPTASTLVLANIGASASAISFEKVTVSGAYVRRASASLTAADFAAGASTGDISITFTISYITA